jgi:formylglycine-generating enzyme required for sulfatase activity
MALFVPRRRNVMKGRMVWLLLGLSGCGDAKNTAIVAHVKRSMTPAQLAVGDPFVNSVGIVLVPIPSGQFLMGSPDADGDALDAEKPQHPVDITTAFYLSAHEVTQAQYAQVTGSDPSFFKGRDHPVDTVSWHDAVAFCRSLSERPEERAAGREYRLPREAEWEYACRAGTTTRFSFGDDPAMLDEYAWFFRNANSRTHAVGQRQPNRWGLCDMHGNVWEWCQDAYHPRAYDRERDVDGPRGPADHEGRVERGGGFTNPPPELRSTARFAAPANLRLFSNGFRVAAMLTH